MRLHVISEPMGAEIRLGGRSIGRAPLTTERLQPGRDYELTASLEGYESVRRLVSRPAAGGRDAFAPHPAVAGPRPPSPAAPVPRSLPLCRSATW